MAPSIASARKWPSATQTQNKTNGAKKDHKSERGEKGEILDSVFTPSSSSNSLSYEGRRIFWAEIVVVVVVVPMKRIRIIVVVVVVVVVKESGYNTHKYTTKLDDRKKRELKQNSKKTVMKEVFGTLFLSLTFPLLVFCIDGLRIQSSSSSVGSEKTNDFSVDFCWLLCCFCFLCFLFCY